MYLAKKQFIAFTIGIISIIMFYEYNKIMEQQTTLYFKYKLNDLINRMQEDKIHLGYRNEKFNNFINSKIEILNELYECNNTIYTENDLMELQRIEIIYELDILNYHIIQSQIKKLKKKLIKYMELGVNGTDTCTIADEFICNFNDNIDNVLIVISMI